MNWFDVLPELVAIEQTAWERDRKVVRLRKMGMKFAEIGNLLGVTNSRAQQLYRRGIGDRKGRHNRPLTAPVERYFAEQQDLQKLTGKYPREVVARMTFSVPKEHQQYISDLAEACRPLDGGTTL